VNLRWVIIGQVALICGHQRDADAMDSLLQRLVRGNQLPVTRTDFELFVLLERSAIACNGRVPLAALVVESSLASAGRILTVGTSRCFTP